MLAHVKKRFRAWMFIYAGLVAAIILSVEPAVEEHETRLEGRELPAAANAPLLRRDI